MGTDPFEEFEFKPLTDGLGFHQKKNANAASVSMPEPTPATQQLKSRGIDFTEDEAASNPFKAPLPRREARGPSLQSPMPEANTPAVSPVDDILNNLHQNRKMEIELDRKHRQELRNPKKTITWKEAAPRLSPFFLDGMLIMAASLLCLIAMLVITRADLVANLANPDAEGMLYLSTFALFAGVAFIYMVVHRVFLGYSPGEWAYDLRLGRPEDQDTAIFIGQVIARQLLITVTGFVILPLIGFAIGKDIAGAAVKLPLLRKS